MAFRDRRHVKAYGGQFRLGRLVCSVCDYYYIMGSSSYVIVLGLIGIVITALDIVRMVHNTFLRIHPNSSHHRHNGEVLDNIERDLKLMTSILGIEHYTLIVLGAITEYPILYAPWLLMQMCVIIMEAVVFIARFFLDGLHIQRNKILQAVFTVYNWLQVFCLFHQQAKRTI